MTRYYTRNGIDYADTQRKFMSESDRDIKAVCSTCGSSYSYNIIEETKRYKPPDENGKRFGMLGFWDKHHDGVCKNQPERHQYPVNGWIKGPPDKSCVSDVILVILKPESELDLPENIREYYNAPVAVTRWENKLKTTLGAIRFEIDDVLYWKPIGPYPGSHTK